MYFTFKTGLVLDCGFPKEFELRDRSGNVFCANENRLVKSYDGCDEDYQRTDKHKYIAISSLNNPNIPRNMCAISSKYHDKYLETASNPGRLRFLRISNEENLISAPEKYFKLDELNSIFCNKKHICTKKGKILNKDRLLQKVGTAVHSKLIENNEICGVDCEFSLKFTNNDSIATSPGTNETSATTPTIDVTSTSKTLGKITDDTISGPMINESLSKGTNEFSYTNYLSL